MKTYDETMRAYQRAVAECAGRAPEYVLTDEDPRGVWLWCAHHDGGVPFYALAGFLGSAWHAVVTEAGLAQVDAAKVRERIKTTAATHLNAKVDQ